ncbi:hypothetical protein HOP38_15115 [Vibrio mediterranei]|uniref:hypothetical protein n=1 Tax=Vibrio mediterranei TaxID=689 RepID=UPI001821A171|nr:hypothetical protein [Vibrio mediterranei]NUW73831.1 hypothetical protein [Vibrio mediterranei]
MSLEKNKDEAFYYICENISGNDKVAWLGDCPIIKSDAVSLNASTNYRAHSSLHAKYDAILLTEKELFSLYPNSWKLVLDEAIRMLCSKGTLIVRTKDSQEGTLFDFKSCLGRNPNNQVSLVDQKIIAGETISVFSVIRLNNDYYKDSSWTFGILSNGEKNENVISLVRKAIKLSGKTKVEFLIAGPKIDELSEYDNVRFIFRTKDNLPRISEKKKLILQEASNANVLLIHDRYQIDDNFFDGFIDFGYDFDFITVRQKYPSGVEFPSYLYFPVNKKIWQSPVKIENLDKAFDSSFLNGGLLVVKKHLADKCNFNALLLHNEAEDVEVSMQMCSIGIYPRINTISVAHTIGINEEYTNTFATDSDVQTKGINKFKKILFSVWCHMPESVRSKIRGTKWYDKAQTLYRR